MSKKDKTVKTEKKINKKYIFISVLILLIIIAIFSVIKTNNLKPNNNIDGIVIIGEPNTQTTPTLTTNEINASSKLEDFYGKPSLIVFAGTYCEHCNTMVPQLEKEIWDRYKLEANIWINVIDGKSGKRFNVKDIAQGYNENLTYEEIIGNCNYVPAYVVLDKDGQEILRSCGSEKTIEEIRAAIASQLE